MEKIVEFFNYENLDIDPNLMINFVPLSATILATTVALIIIIQKLRLRYSKTVNCWFCNKNTKIHSLEKNWWKCKSCHQYNGFSKDGDYIYDIPEQRKQSLNKKNMEPYLSSVKREPSNLINKKNGLCEKCNNNEEKKMYELQSINTDNWRQSNIDNFIKNLEIKYQLCHKCDRYVQDVLHKQSKWLTQYKMLFFKKKSFNLIVKNSGRFEYYGRLFLTMLSAIVIYYPTLQPLPLFGALLQLIIVAKKINSNGTFDALLTLVWLAVFGLMPIHNFKLFKLDIKHSLFTIEYLTGYQIITILSTTLGYFNITSKTNFTSNSNVSFKKLDNSMNESMDSTTEINEVVNKSNEIASDRRSPVNITHLLTSPNYLPAPSPVKPTIISPNFRICDSQQGSSPVLMENFHDHQDKSELPSKKTLNESTRNLSSLSLSSANKKQISKSPRVFETKTYGTTSPDLFKYNNSYNKSSKFILAPPKLKSVTQTSWVAGGYWQMGMNPSTLSRSSSQSSGFGSTNSNFGQSREPSVVNEIDRCSILSDATVCCHSSHNITPTNSFCSHSSSCRLSNSGNSFTNVMPCFQQPQTICHNSYQYQNDFMMNRSTSNCSSVQQNISDMPICNNHSTNYLSTNPSWLPALVCGSIFLNIVVFCTVLMR